MVEENNVKVPDVTSSDSSSSGDEKTLKKMRDKAKLPHCKDCPKHTSFCADCIAAKQDKEEEEKGFRRRAVYGDLVPLTTKKSRVTKKKVDVKLKNPPSKSPQNSALDISRNSASSSRSMSFNFSNRRNTGPNLRSLNDSAMQSDKSSVKFESNLVSVGTQTDAVGPINSSDSKESTLKPNTLGVKVAPRRLNSERKVQYARPKSADEASDKSSNEGRKKIDVKSNSSKVKKSKSKT